MDWWNLIMIPSLLILGSIFFVSSFFMETNQLTVFGMNMFMVFGSAVTLGLGVFLFWLDRHYDLSDYAPVEVEN